MLNLLAFLTLYHSWRIYGLIMSSNGSVLIYHLDNKCCLELMRLHSSILLLVINMDSLQYGRVFYRYPLVMVELEAHMLI